MTGDSRNIKRFNEYEDAHQKTAMQNKTVQYKKAKKRRRKKIVRRIGMTFLIMLSILIGWATARLETRLTYAFNTMNRDSFTDLSSVKVNKNNLNSNDKIHNILLVGSDKRADWSQKGRSDSTMVATLDLKNKRLKLTSLMRDMYVSIPGYEDNKFNAAYSFGGVSLLYQTIAENFDLKLDGYVVVDFAAFKTVINEIGGVKINLTNEEYTYLTTAYKKGSVLELKEGMNTMNGEQALAYSRIRQDAEGDFGRTKRQRKVLQAIFTEIKSMSFSKIIKLGEKILPYISTDLTNDEILSYLKSVIMMGTTTIDQMRIPIDGSYTQDRIRNMAVLIPDLETNKEALNEFIFKFNGKEEIITK